MNKSKIKKIATLHETKYIGLYDVEYINKLGEVNHWAVSSRKGESELKKIYLENKDDNVDAVVLVALHEESNKLVLIKQFRVPINDFIYELPAGLIDKGESITDAVKRELKEETGLILTNINNVKTMDKLYLSPGMTDESVSFVYCTCKGELSKEFLEDDEEIEAYLISQEEASLILQKDEKIDIKSFLILQMFIQIGSKMFE